MKALKMNLTGLIALFVLGAYLHIYHAAAVALALTAGVYTIAAITLALALGGLAFTYIYFGERLRIMRANRIALERDAHLTVIQNDKTGIVFTRDTDKAAVYHALHLERSRYSNGHAEPVTDEDTLAWQRWIMAQAKPGGGRAGRIIEGEAIPALPAGEPSRPLDLLTELDTVERCLIVAPSKTGKTTLLQWIVSRRLAYSQVVVVDPHSYPEKWLGCDVVGTGRNFADIEATLAALVELMTRRYAEIGRGEVAEGDHAKIVVVIDEWRAIVKNVGNASDTISALLTESRKAAFSVFVGTHSERVKALGLEGEGDLKDGFTIVRLGFSGGERIALIDYGKGEIAAALPGLYYPRPIQSEAARPFSIPTGPKVTATEQEILDLRAEGESYRAISQAVYGSVGGKQTAQIKAILAKFGEK